MISKFNTSTTDDLLSILSLEKSSDHYIILRIHFNETINPFSLSSNSSYLYKRSATIFSYIVSTCKQLPLQTFCCSIDLNSNPTLLSQLQKLDLVTIKFPPSWIADFKCLPNIENVRDPPNPIEFDNSKRSMKGESFYVFRKLPL